MRKSSLPTAALVVALSQLSSCGGVLGLIGGSEGELSYLTSALSVADTALNLRETLSPFAFRPQAVCASGSGITPGTCLSGRRTDIYGDCTGRFTGATYSGSLALAFSNTGGCSVALAEDETLGITTTTFQSTSADGTKIQWSSASNSTYGGSAYGGGFELEGTSGSTLYLRVNGITRTKKTEVDTSIYEHVIHTSTALNIGTGFEAGNRSLSGLVTVDSNSGEFTASLNLTALIWGSNDCCYPLSGTVDVTYGGSRSGTRSYDFSGTCGKITDATSGEALTLDPCI